MNILIGTELLPDDPKWAWSPERPVTGTEKFYVRVAEELARFGHDVNVDYGGPYLKHNGVTYHPRSGDWLQLRADLLLDCNFQREYKDSRYPRLQWTSFYNRTDVCVGDGYDRLLVVSEYVKSTITHALRAPATAVELGTDAFDIVYPALASRPKTCAYTSSPDRGGVFLKTAWPEIEAATGYALECTPYGSDFSEADVRALLERSRFWLYPATGTDSTVSALEAQAAGCIPFYVPHMGLPETCRYGIQSDLNRFKQNLIATLKSTTSESLTTWENRRFEALAERPIPTWADVAERILEIAQEVRG